LFAGSQWIAAAPRPSASTDDLAAFQSGGSQDMRQFYDKANKLSAQTKGKVFNTSVSAKWFHNNTRFWFKNDLRGGTREFIVVDAELGTRGPAFDHKRLADALSKAAEAMYTAEKLPFDSISFVDDSSSLEFQAAGFKWKCNLTSYECLKLGKADPKKDSPPTKKKKKEEELDPNDLFQETIDMEEEAAPFGLYDVPQKKGGANKGGKEGGGKQGGSKEAKSPDGKWTALVKDFNIHVRDASGKMTQLTKGNNFLQWK
jgi:hypothetical protein